MIVFLLNVCPKNTQKRSLKNLRGGIVILNEKFCEIRAPTMQTGDDNLRLDVNSPDLSKSRSQNNYQNGCCYYICWPRLIFRKRDSFGLMLCHGETSYLQSFQQKKTKTWTFTFLTNFRTIKLLRTNKVKKTTFTGRMNAKHIIQWQTVGAALPC